MRRRRWVGPAVAGALVVAAAGCADGASMAEPDVGRPGVGEPAAARSGVEGPAPAPDGRGDHEVGRSTFTVSDPARGGRTFGVDVWYPAGGPDGEPSFYELLDGVGISGTAVDDAPVAEGRFPLVVFSHGGGATRHQALHLTEGLASHGFVVAAPDHPGNTTLDEVGGSNAPFEVLAVDRPLDVALVIDRMLERSSLPDDPLAGRIDGDRVAVAGHALGGFTALAAAGGTASVEPDARVGAVVPIAPLTSLLSDGDLVGIEQPTLLIGGTADVVAPVVDLVTRPFELIEADRLLRIDVAGAGHFSFTETCRTAEAVAASELALSVRQRVAARATLACPADAVPVDEVQRLTRRYVVAFLRAHLVGDARYEPFLEPAEGVEVLNGGLR